VTYSLESLILFSLFVGAGAYIHTVSGFALGMVIMGSSAILHLAPVPVAAAVVALITMVNGLFALPGAFHKIYWRGTAFAMISILPSMIVGVLLLNYLNQASAQLLRALLGIVILLGAAHLIYSISPKEQVSGSISFLLSGAFGGIFGGLFGIAGPPMIYHYYRQPLELSAIRNSLIFLFAFISIGRSIFITIQGQLDSDILRLTAVSIPAVIIATLLGRYFPPKMSGRTMRWFVTAVLICIGGNLLIDATLQFI
jgi:uncharacterized membrane protein YfcA